MKFTIRSLILLMILLALLFGGVFALVPKPLEVEVSQVREGTLRVTIREDGKTRIREKYVVSAPVAGRLSRIELQAGDAVYGGDQSLLAVIQPSPPAMLDAREQSQADARVRAAEATLNRSQAHAEQASINFDLSKKKYQRAQKLAVSNGISQNEFEIAKAEFLAGQQAIISTRFEADVAKFELEMAKAATAQFTVDDVHEPFEIFSPISGRVLNVFQESSQVVTAGTPLLEIGDTKNLEIEIDVLSTDAVRVKPGSELVVEHWGGEQPLKGIVRMVEPAAFTKVSSLGVEEQRVNIIADFDEPYDRISRLGDGFRIETQITVEKRENVILVPNSSLFRRRHVWHVFVVTNGVAELREVKIGPQNESDTQVLDGLSAGDQVIIYPTDQVADGIRIKQ